MKQSIESRSDGLPIKKREAISLSPPELMGVNQSEIRTILMYIYSNSVTNKAVVQ